MIDFRAALIFSMCIIATYFIIKRNKLHSKLLFHIGYVLYSKTRLGYYYHKRIVSKSKGYHSNPKTLTIDGFTIHVIPILSDNYSYLIVDNLSNQGVVIDPADGYTVQRFVTDNKVNLKAILTTHKHWDHAGGNAVLKYLYPDLLIYGSREDSPLLVNRYINERICIKIGQLQFQARLTPGHTMGHVVYILTSTTKQHCLFSGDHLFSGGCGRVFEGTYEQMLKSLQIIMTMEQSTLIFPGHEYTYKNVKFALLLEPTNKNVERKVDEIRLLRITREPTVPSILSDELQYNPFLRTSLLRDLENFKSENEIGVLQKLREFKDTVNHTL